MYAPFRSWYYVTLLTSRIRTSDYLLKQSDKSSVPIFGIVFKTILNVYKSVTWWTLWGHCRQNWSIFNCLTTVEPKSWPLTFSSITSKRYVVDISIYTFLNRYNRGISWYGFWRVDDIQATFEFDPCTNFDHCTKNLVTLHVQQVTTTRQQYVVLILCLIPT